MKSFLQTLPCGIDISVEQPELGAVTTVRLTNSTSYNRTHIKSWLTDDGNDVTPETLTIFVKSENLPVLAGMLNELLPKPTFFDKLKSLFRS